MHDPEQKPTHCAVCGHAIAPGAGACPVCEPADAETGMVPSETSVWVRERNSLKMKWVASVLAFWVSAAVLVAVYVIKDKLDLTLISIVLGMLLIGLWLKTRYQRHLRKEPGRQ